MRVPRRSGGPRPGIRPPPLVIALSGADGSGKSTIARALALRLEAEGHAVVSVYTYGCVVCRRIPKPLCLTVAGGRPMGGSVRTERLLRILNEMHAVVDAAELRVRLWAAVRMARSKPTRETSHYPASRDGSVGSGPSRQADEAPPPPSVEHCAPRPIVVAERSSLDGLVKYDPAPGTLASRALRSAASRYAMVVWLDAPAALLVERDHEHDFVVLNVLASRFERYASTLPRVLRADAAAPVGDVVSSIVDRVAGPTTPPGDEDRRER